MGLQRPYHGAVTWVVLQQPQWVYMELHHQFRWHKSKQPWTATRWLGTGLRSGISATILSNQPTVTPTTHPLLLPNSNTLPAPHLLIPETSALAEIGQYNLHACLSTSLKSLTVAQECIMALSQHFCFATRDLQKPSYFSELSPSNLSDNEWQCHHKWKNLWSLSPCRSILNFIH